MKFTFKPLLPFPVIILFVLLSEQSVAQTPYIRTTVGLDVAGYIKGRKANKEFDQKYKMGEMMPYSIMGMRFINSTQYGFEILLNDSTKQKTYNPIQFDSVERKTYLVVVNKNFPKSDPDHRNQKIYPDQTTQIYRTNYSGKKIIGISKDSCWMFKIISGAINVYSYLSEESGPTFQESTIIGIQSGDGPILKYSAENLKQMVGNDPEALESVDSKDYLNAIRKYNRDIQKSSKKWSLFCKNNRSAFYIW